MKTIMILVSTILTGCASMDQIVCTGTGTCGHTTQYSQAAKWVSPTPQTVITDQGTYLIVRDSSTGAISSIISTSKGK